MIKYKHWRQKDTFKFQSSLSQYESKEIKFTLCVWIIINFEMEEHENRNVPSDMISFYNMAHTYRKKNVKEWKIGNAFYGM